MIGVMFIVLTFRSLFFLSSNWHSTTVKAGERQLGGVLYYFESLITLSSLNRS